ncbi:class I SAM-dependent methyltransferase [Bacteroidota bacterium]
MIPRLSLNQIIFIAVLFLIAVCIVMNLFLDLIPFLSEILFVLWILLIVIVFILLHSTALKDVSLENKSIAYKISKLANALAEEIKDRKETDKKLESVLVSGQQNIQKLFKTDLADTKDKLYSMIKEQLIFVTNRLGSDLKEHIRIRVEKELKNEIRTKSNLISSEIDRETNRIKVHINEKYSSYYETYKNLTTETKNYYLNLMSLLSLHSTLEFNYTLPLLDGWAVSPDFANLICYMIYERKPEVVVELGSGVSSLIIALCLKKIGKGKLVTVEQSKEYFSITGKYFKLYDLESNAKIIHAPVQKIDINNDSWSWYSITKNMFPGKIDFLIVDGPSGDLQKMARYPALPFLKDRLSDDPIVILDDGSREDEQEIVKRWSAEYPDYGTEFIENEKGAFILKRKNVI